MKKRAFISSCEGCISRNNNLFDLASHFVPEGDRIYDMVTKYSYVNANFSHKKDPKIATASALVLPFLLAFDANNKNVEQFSADSLILSDHCKEALEHLSDISNAFILSSSYEHHARAICRETGFPLENFYCTRVNLDKLVLSESEKSKIKSLAWEIGSMPPMKLSPYARSFRDLSGDDQKTVRKLDDIFWKEISRTKCKAIFNEIRVINNAEKVNILQNLAESTASSLEDFIYVGVDFSDVDVMKLVKSSGGASVSFNGQEYTVRSADIAILSKDYAPVGLLADLFLRFGKDDALRAAGNFDKEALWLSSADPKLLHQMLETKGKSWPKVFIVTEWNVEKIVALIS